MSDAPVYERRYVLFFALFCALAAVLPSLYAAFVAVPPGTQYLGTEWATDDHMVYASWTRQAMEGAFLFDNRFTVAEQPGLTIHLFFWVLGQVARITGIALAFGIARFVLAGLFVWLVYKFIRRLTTDTYTIKLALTLTVFGAGVGYLVWHKFGEAIVLSKPAALTNLMLGRLPTDGWQPEAFVFPSMLTTGLFLASLCLIVFIFGCFLDCRDNPRAVLPGAIAMLLLMNIHSYDVLLVAMVMAGFLLMSVVRKQVTAQWVWRSVGIAAGVLPSGAWFAYVLKNDPVFQQRAATLTYSPNFRQFFFGYLILLILGLLYTGIAHREEGQRRPWLPAAAAAVLLIAMFFASTGHTQGYWLGLGAWLALFAVGLALLAWAAKADTAFNLVLAWALVGIIAPYFPGLFQRKLAMGLAIPWAILASLGLAYFMLRMERGQRNLVSILAILVVCGSSALWFQRQLSFVKSNVSRSVHPVYVGRDVTRILDYLASHHGRKVVLAMPGLSYAPTPDQLEILMPDLNPIVSGLSGSYTYAGHWSETPNYNKARSELTSFFVEGFSDDAARKALLAKSGATHIIAPVPEAFENLPELANASLADLSKLGNVVVDGQQFRLLELSP